VSTLHSVRSAGSASPTTSFVVGVAGLAVVCPAAAAADYPTESEALAAFFPAAATIERELCLVDEPGTLELRRDRTPRHLFRHVARDAEGRVLGAAVVEDVMGKARPITYMLAVDRSGTVLGIEVLVYRESHGHEIGRDAFRRQFVGEDADARLELDADIRNISGATISCRSITNGVADLLDLLERVPAAEDRVAATATEPAPTEPVAEAPGRLVRTQVVMNTSLTLVLEDEGATRAELMAHGDAAFAELRRLEGLWSAFEADSDVARLNAAAGGDALAVRPETRELLGLALDLAERTSGAYDPAAGALTKLVKAAGPMPNAAALEAARRQSGRSLVELGQDATARLSRRGAALDLGGSAKGRALDRVAELLADRGLASGSFNFGGQVLVLGPGQRTVEDRGGFGPVTLAGGSLATTGDAERSAPDGASTPGARRSHLVDPRSGRPVPVHGAVQVHASTALEADALSTALYVLGPDAAWDLCLDQGIAARFEVEAEEPVESAHSPLPSERCTPAWRERFGGER